MVCSAKCSSSSTVPSSSRLTCGGTPITMKSSMTASAIGVVRGGLGLAALGDAPHARQVVLGDDQLADLHLQPGALGAQLDEALAGLVQGPLDGRRGAAPDVVHVLFLHESRSSHDTKCDWYLNAS